MEGSQKAAGAGNTWVATKEGLGGRALQVEY